jgi:hypothetical protein
MWDLGGKYVLANKEVKYVFLNKIFRGVHLVLLFYLFLRFQNLMISLFSFPIK